MDEYIIKQQAIDACLDGYASCVNDCIDNIKSLPAIDVYPVIHAYWIFDDFDDDNFPYQCSNCELWARTSHDFCPYCGADMRKIIIKENNNES